MKIPMRFYWAVIIIGAVLFISAFQQHALPKTESAAMCNLKEYTVNPVLYQQQSGEYRALAYQAFSLARLRTDEALRKKNGKEKLALITDLDETMLDNGKFDAHLINKNSYFTPSLWDEWVSMKKADSLPGSVSFLKYADSKLIDIFYITNRTQKQLSSTMENMQQLGFPQVAANHFLMRDKSSNKQARFDSIAKSFHVFMQLGDNLNDFSGIFYHQTAFDRKRLTDSLNADFGNRFIVLPNSSYGDWEDAFYGYYKVDTTNAMKDSRRHSLLVDY